MLHRNPDEGISVGSGYRDATWADSNAQYYGSYYGRRNLRYRSLPDFRPIPTFELACGIPGPRTEDR